jgi:two-component system alkaline phosphatase synthesis response regulator PhoP
LIAQIKALFGHFKEEKVEVSESLSFGDINMDLKQYRVTIKQKEIELTKMEFDLLKFFILNKEQALSRDTILNSIWGFNYDGTTRIVDVHVYNLKKKIENSSCFFKPVRAVGYSLFLK